MSILLSPRGLFGLTSIIPQPPVQRALSRKNWLFARSLRFGFVGLEERSTCLYLDSQLATIKRKMCPPPAYEYGASSTAIPHADTLNRVRPFLVMRVIVSVLGGAEIAVT